MISSVRPGRRGVAACAALVVALSVAGCSGGSGSSKAPAPKSGTAGSSAAAAATRWWSNSAVTVGSPIDPADPGAAAAHLHPSQSDYCGMLKQTLDSRKSILPNASAGDPALLVSTEAFVAEIQQVAPAGITGSWQVLGPAIIGLIKSGGALPTSTAGTTAQNLAAVEAVAADAKKNCNLDLSAIVTGG
jgi:hypothetical protein